MRGTKCFAILGIGAFGLTLMMPDADAREIRLLPGGNTGATWRCGPPPPPPKPGARKGSGMQRGVSGPNLNTQSVGHRVTRPVNPRIMGMEFQPGQTSSFSWNGTTDVEKNPILVYVYDRDSKAGTDFEYSKSMESDVFENSKVRQLSREFICEKVSSDDAEFSREVTGREAVAKYLNNVQERDAHVAMLDSYGGLIESFTVAELESGARGFEQKMRLALEENQRRTVQ